MDGLWMVCGFFMDGFMDGLWMVYGWLMDGLWMAYWWFLVVYGWFMDGLWMACGWLMDGLWMVYGLWIVYGCFMAAWPPKIKKSVLFNILIGSIGICISRGHLSLWNSICGGQGSSGVLEHVDHANPLENPRGLGTCKTMETHQFQVL